MDALRKAEKEKKEAEKKQQLLEEEGGQEVDNFASGNAENTGEEIAVEDTGEQEIRRLDPTKVRSREEIFAATSKLSLAPINQAAEPEHEDTRAMEMPEQSDRPGTHDSQSGDDFDELPDDDNEAGFLQKTGASDSDILDETFHNENIDTDSIPGLYEDTMQGEEYATESESSFDETLPGVPAADLVRDIGDEFQPTPVAAQTVFSASGTTRVSSGLNWPVVTGALVIAIIAIGFITYNWVTPVARDLPSPMVAQGIENIVPLEPVIDISNRPVSGALIEQPQDRSRPVAVEASPGPVVTTISATAIEAEPEQYLSPADDEEIITVEEELQEDTVLAVNDVDAIESVSSGDSLPLVIEVPSAQIKISRSKVPELRSQLVNEAFSAYKDGNESLAKARYEEALASYPDNRDALLGLGAIAINNADIVQAYEYYSRLLLTNPQDVLARAALINLERDSDLVSKESVIRTILYENPEDPFLHFTLGNIYAAQLRWPEAQQAFFDAYRFDSTNPDYANNLAISLDHIGQSESALDYYQTALKLADTSKANFVKANVISRIQVLSKP